MENNSHFPKSSVKVEIINVTKLNWTCFKMAAVDRMTNVWSEEKLTRSLLSTCWPADISFHTRLPCFTVYHPSMASSQTPPPKPFPRLIPLLCWWRRWRLTLKQTRGTSLSSVTSQAVNPCCCLFFFFWCDQECTHTPPAAYIFQLKDTAPCEAAPWLPVVES